MPSDIIVVREPVQLEVATHPLIQEWVYRCPDTKNAHFVTHSPEQELLTTSPYKVRCRDCGEYHCCYEVAGLPWQNTGDTDATT